MTAPSHNRPAARGLSGRHVLASMLAFFGVIVVADAIMIYNAVSTFGGVDNKNAYRDGLAYNARIASAARQAGLGWHDTAEIFKDPARVRVTMRDTAGQPLHGLSVEATLGRPATIRADTTLKLVEVAPGVFEAPVGGDIEGGSWIATVRAARAANADGEPEYRMRRRLWVEP